MKRYKEVFAPESTLLFQNSRTKKKKMKRKEKEKFQLPIKTKNSPDWGGSVG